jgi:peptidyl-tRNA hydrolase
MSTAKLTLVVRGDLSKAQQAVQAAHAARQFVEDYPALEREWFHNSNTLALLTVPDEKALLRLLEKAEDRGTRVSLFREPDIHNQLTAICIEPGPTARKLCGGLPLALQDP